MRLKVFRVLEVRFRVLQKSLSAFPHSEINGGRVSALGSSLQLIQN